MKRDGGRGSHWWLVSVIAACAVMAFLLTHMPANKASVAVRTQAATTPTTLRHRARAAAPTRTTSTTRPDTTTPTNDAPQIPNFVIPTGAAPSPHVQAARQALPTGPTAQGTAPSTGAPSTGAPSTGAPQFPTAVAPKPLVAHLPITD
jgi:hypothetical protein